MPRPWITASTSTTLLLRGSIITMAVAVYFGVSCRPASTASDVSSSTVDRITFLRRRRMPEKLLDIQPTFPCRVGGLPLGVLGYGHGVPAAERRRGACYPNRNLPYRMSDYRKMAKC